MEKFCSKAMQRNSLSQSLSTIARSCYSDQAPWPLLATTDLLSCCHLMADKFISQTVCPGNGGGGISGTLLIFLPNLPAYHNGSSSQSFPQQLRTRALLDHEGQGTALDTLCLKQSGQTQIECIKHRRVGTMREGLGEHQVMRGHGQRWMAQSFPASSFWSQQVKEQPP